MNLAPIGLSVYTRIEHLKKTIYALQNNHLASESLLYVFSDGPKPGDEVKVQEIRNYIKRAKGFKHIEIFERKSNNRVFNNRNGIKTLLDEYGKMIYLEEDILTAPNFLKFINNGLHLFEDRHDIFAICGYSPPVDFSGFYNHPTYLSPRFSAWGFGIWKSTFEQIVYDRNEFKVFLSNTKNIKQLSKNGKDLPSLLKRDANGEIDALDVKIFYTQLKYNLFTIAPTISLTNNIGHDGTGTHCGKTNKFDAVLPTDPYDILFDENICINKTIVQMLYEFRNSIAPPLSTRILNRINSLFKGVIHKIISSNKQNDRRS